MAKSANVYVRIEPEVKEQAEHILNLLGVPVSNAISMFYKQIILTKGLPFEIKLPEQFLNINHMTNKQLDEELEKGYADMQDGNLISSKKVFDDIRKDYNI